MIFTGKPFTSLSAAAICCACSATCRKVSSPYRNWLPAINQASGFLRSVILYYLHAHRAHLFIGSVAIIGTRPMFSFVMFSDQSIFHTLRLRIDLLREVRHPGDFLQYRAVVYSLLCCCAPGKRCMAAHEDHFDFLIIESSLFEALQYLKSGLVLVVALDHLIGHRSGAGYVVRTMVGVCCSVQRNVAQCLCPACSVRGVCVGNATYAFPVLIQHCVCQRIGRWTQLPFYFRAVEVDDHHTRWRQQVIGHTAGFDGEDTEVTVGRADISECMNDKTQTREIHVCLVRRFFYVIEFRHAKTRESITCAIR